MSSHKSFTSFNDHIRFKDLYAKICELEKDVKRKLSKSGGTMTGDLILCAEEGQDSDLYLCGNDIKDVNAIEFLSGVSLMGDGSTLQIEGADICMNAQRIDDVSGIQFTNGSTLMIEEESELKGDTTVENAIVQNLIYNQDESPNIPLTSNASGIKGQIVYDVDHLYICIDNGQWVRANLSSW